MGYNESGRSIGSGTRARDGGAGRIPADAAAPPASLSGGGRDGPARIAVVPAPWGVGDAGVAPTTAAVGAGGTSTAAGHHEEGIGTGARSRVAEGGGRRTGCGAVEGWRRGGSGS